MNSSDHQNGVHFFNKPQLFQEVYMKLSRLLLAGITCVSIAFVSVNAASSSEQKSAAPKKATHVATGKIVSVDAIANSLIVKTASAEDTFYVDSTTVVKSGKTKITLGELTSGAPVTVYYKKAEGRKLATSITEKKPKAAKPS
jgi:hypothetical protein